MKSLLFLLLMVTQICLSAQDKTAINEKRIDSLLNKINAKQATGEEKKELYDIAVSMQNKAQEQDAKYHQYKKSLSATDRVIALFTALDDTLDIASNIKYKGYLLGKNGKFLDARRETEAAISLYQIKNLSAAVAISQFDLARMFEFENKYDSAIYYAETSCAFWKSKAVDERVIIANNMLVSLFLKLNQPEKAMAVQEKSSVLVKKSALQWQSVIDFYFTSMLLYRTVNDNATANDFQGLYLAKIDALKNQGIAASSYYERDRQ